MNAFVVSVFVLSIENLVFYRYELRRLGTLMVGATNFKTGGTSMVGKHMLLCVN